MEVKWDETKRLTNLRRHGIDFADVWQFFENETYTQIDDRFDYGEMRFLSLGLLFGEVIAVSHMEYEGVIRIISARKAEKHEQEAYFKEVRD
jgi:uncharacterized protein